MMGRPPLDDGPLRKYAGAMRSETGIQRIQERSRARYAADLAEGRRARQLREARLNGRKTVQRLGLDLEDFPNFAKRPPGPRRKVAIS